MMNSTDDTTQQQRRWDDDEWGGEDDEILPDTRAGARRLALQALYWEVASPGQLEEALRQRATAASMGADNVEFAGSLARGCIIHSAEIKELIAATATNWHPSRIARLDGLILQLALTELLYLDDSPARVAIHEAVELAKAYGGDKSHAFVNGVLDAIARQRGIQI
ncbi:MAG TPA: transcription antitermination factor NusB [Candidatus Latescibacteria bacterium]|jgi:N utilization substance protein B|nr:transcription antitermination factor NusB [Candidatus Latescibacterota bacterium]|tara:strand:+ start:1421 stop:1918 length:498 start_codon:yes stop_codon:yes gene_type:complete